MDIIYSDKSVIVCIKPAGVLSTDEEGGVPELLRAELGNISADIRTVHRLDRAVGGLMVLARNARAASELSRQIRDGEFEKEYAAIVHGYCDDADILNDILWRDKARKMTFVVPQMLKGAQTAELEYRTVWRMNGMSRVQIRLHTGRTHQIRVQFSSRGFPLVGERKYCEPTDDCALALWSYRIGFTHPESGERMSFSAKPPQRFPWDISSM